eukprot:SM000169S02722  [mRNA]  locus=s169:218085:227241:+ [translate_table: standard]
MAGSRTVIIAGVIDTKLRGSTVTFRCLLSYVSNCKTHKLQLAAAKWASTVAQGAHRQQYQAQEACVAKGSLLVEVGMEPLPAVALPAVVLVESPAKARTIEQYLGPGYQVLATYGHMRDLPSRTGSVLPNDNFAMRWEIMSTSRQHLQLIKDSLRSARRLILATDPDREGEAISWHMLEVLQSEGALAPGMSVQRVTFHEITKRAVLQAMASPRSISKELVDAYMARKALDYLIGFSLSPILWSKLPGSRSAGRVQSIALRMICERESEVEAFKSKEYWSVEAELKSPRGASFTTRLTHLQGKKLSQLDLESRKLAEMACHQLAGAQLLIQRLTRQQVRRSPPLPYTTSSLQQDAASKLGFGAERTMSLAQVLYEGSALGGDNDREGLITYMRTDGVQLADEAVASIRALATTIYGDRYCPPTPRVYRSKTKNAQEAHEAIRPTNIARLPSSLTKRIDDGALRLYTLIWCRTMACQMADALIDRECVDIATADSSIQLRTTSSRTAFPGFLGALDEQKGLEERGKREDPGMESQEGDTALPFLQEGEQVAVACVNPKQHFTQPPPRFSEGTLVKALEDAGIGRPSTYASTIRTLLGRNYIRLDRRRLIPEYRGRMVAAFLAHFFAKYMEYGFTADIEGQLDEVAGGRADWRSLLQGFWGQFEAAVDDSRKLSHNEVVQVLEQIFECHFPRVPEEVDGKKAGGAEALDPRRCPRCREGRLGMQLSRHGAGAFIGCSAYPSCNYTISIDFEPDLGDSAESSSADAANLENDDITLGQHPVTGLQIVANGPYGPYVQMGDAVGKRKPRRASLPKDMKLVDVTFGLATSLLALPRSLGAHLDEGGDVQLKQGPYGLYVKHSSTSAVVPKVAFHLTSLRVTFGEASTGISNAMSAQTLLIRQPQDKTYTEDSCLVVKAACVLNLIILIRQELVAEDVTLEMAVEFLRTKRAVRPSKKSATKVELSKAHSGNPSTSSAKDPLEDVKTTKSKGKGKGGKELDEEVTKKQSPAAQPVHTSPDFASFLGGVSTSPTTKELTSIWSSDVDSVVGEISRPMALKRVWEYIKVHKLQDPQERRKIVFDDRLRTLFNADAARTTDLMKLLSPHLMKKAK